MKIILLGIIISLFIIIGIIIGYFLRSNKKGVGIITGFLFSTLLIICLHDIGPKTFSMLKGASVLPNLQSFVGISDFQFIVVVISFVIGFLIIKLYDNFIPYHEHEAVHNHRHTSDRCYKNHLHHVGRITTPILFLYNIIQGMTLYAVASSDYKSGLILSIIIGICNLPVGLLVASSLQTSKSVATSSIVLILGPFIGGILMSTIASGISEVLVGTLLSAMLGMIFYLIVFELLGQIIHSNDKKSHIIGIVMGVVVMAFCIIIY